MTPETSETGTGLSRRTLAEETLIVLGLTFLASAAYAIVSLLSAPIRGVSVAVFREVGLERQVLDIVFGLVPVWLVVYLVRRSGEGTAGIGLAWDEPRRDLGRGAVLALLVATVGLGVYVLAVEIGLNRIVIPVPPTGHWWTVPILALGAFQNGLLEETIVAAYLLHRLRQQGWSDPAALWSSAVLRGAYHLYQGFGGFTGNLALGLFFGAYYQRKRRTWPLVLAHTLVDLLAGLGYLLLRDRASFI
ncbi:MAG TPA: type II CAAX endopeptidase family protein [Actinomycetota bacterium]|nr:type II CAAX endopeptidase family protein [Actinomycetota bacterium]